MTPRSSDQTNPTPLSSSSTDLEIVLDELLDGAEAKDLLVALLDARINQHALRNLRSHVHREEPDSDAVSAKRRLRAAREELLDRLSGSRRQGQTLRLRVSLTGEAAATSAAESAPRDAALRAG